MLHNHVIGMAFGLRWGSNFMILYRQKVHGEALGLDNGLALHVERSSFGLRSKSASTFVCQKYALLTYIPEKL